MRGGVLHVIVVIHAAATAFGAWDDFKKIVGSWWALGKTGHGRVHNFTVKITDTGHPVTNGMKPFVTGDELWHRIGKYDKLNVLATAFAAKAKGGSGQDEPVVHWRTFGKGRIFHLVLGHATQFALGRIGADLLVTGHTHGGQVCLPLVGPLVTSSKLPKRHSAGLLDLADGTQVYVSRGIGMERGHAPRLRFLCRPELTVLELVPQ